MDQFVVELLMLPGEALSLLGAGLVLLGGLVAGFALRPVGAAMRRVTYFWVVVGLGTGLGLVQASWSLVPAAAEAGFLSFLVIGSYALIAASGGVLYAASAARSNDISGNTSQAWLGFVPVANLWLTLAPRNKKKMPARESRHWAARWIMDPALIVVAMMVFSHGTRLTRIQGAERAFGGMFLSTP